MHLTDCEREILQGIAEGLPYKCIADRRGTSPRTIELQTTTLRKKLGARDRANLVHLGYQLGFLRVEEPA